MYSSWLFLSVYLHVEKSDHFYKWANDELLCDSSGAEWILVSFVHLPFFFLRWKLS